MRNVMIALIVLVAVFGGFTALALAQQSVTTAVVVLPQIDAASLAALKPVATHINDLNKQMVATQADFRIAQQAALAAANPPLDPAYYRVTCDRNADCTFAQLRQPQHP